jgi:hypothetical protein
MQSETRRSGPISHLRLAIQRSTSFYLAAVCYERPLFLYQVGGSGCIYMIGMIWICGEMCYDGCIVMNGRGFCG